MVIERRNQWLITLLFSFWQCESHGIPLPTLDEVDNKATQFNEARHYMYNEDDVDKVYEKLKQCFIQILISDYSFTAPMFGATPPRVTWTKYKKYRTLPVV